MPVAERKLTWDDIRDWPEDAGRKTELFDGRLVVSPTPGSAHGIAGSDLGGLLWNHVRKRRLGRLFLAPMSVVLAPDRVVEPDLCFVARERLAIVERARIAGPPDVCIEIVSDSGRERDERWKFEAYARHGVREYWLVDPAGRRIRTFRNDDGKVAALADVGPGERVVSAVFPDLTLDPADVFAEV